MSRQSKIQYQQQKKIKPRIAFALFLTFHQTFQNILMRFSSFTPHPPLLCTIGAQPFKMPRWCPIRIIRQLYHERLSACYALTLPCLELLCLFHIAYGCHLNISLTCLSRGSAFFWHSGQYSSIGICEFINTLRRHPSHKSL